MKKGIGLSVLAVILIAVVVCAIWYINEEGKMRTGSKDAFIPYNSAIVMTVNDKVVWAPEVQQAFAADWKAFREKLLVRVADTLQSREYVKRNPYVLAVRVEGKKDTRFLYVMDSKDLLSRGEVSNFLVQAFAAGNEKVRKYDRHKIYTLQQGGEVVYFAVCGGIVLISDSDLYIEDGLKQFDQEETGTGEKPHYRNVNKYFSAGAGVNIWLNTSAFTDLLPLYVQAEKIFPHVDVTRFFKWGALDGDFSTQGVCLNGFLDYSSLPASYMLTLEKQQARESSLDGVLPAALLSVGFLNLSQPETYLSALESYRYTIGEKETIFRRKQQFVKMFGNGFEEELQDLLHGEFAMGQLAYQETTGEREALMVVGLKSGSLCKVLLERMMKNYARFAKCTPESFLNAYGLDREKSFQYYRFPVEDFPAVCWGDIFEGIKSRYVWVEDNYLIFASSENAVKCFIKDYVHGNFIRDVEWYQHLKGRLAAKSNIAYFARMEEMLPFYRSFTQDSWQKFLTCREAEIPVFSSWAWQGSNEGNMLYTTLFLSTTELQEENRPHVLWQTKLDARVSMKPVSVVNHATGERELFVQDDHHTVYLLNDAGRVLWKVPLTEKINSEVYQVDLFKNGKLQYLFSTPSRMYLIDRNGNSAGRFPIDFKTRCNQGITVYDYENDRNYRIFVPCEDQMVYLYGLDGKPVQGWNPRKADKQIVSKVEHFRIDGKDYIVFADQYRFYILDRRGNERVKVSSVFDLPSHTEVYLVHKKGHPFLLFAGKGGQLNLVDFSGRTEVLKIEGLSDCFAVNVADWDQDGDEEVIFTEDNRLLIVRLDGSLLLKKEIAAESLGFPYVYRFSAHDIRIGTSDPEAQQLLLLTTDGKLSEGFPVSGSSPFSIVFSGEDGFFLFAGNENVILKYKVLR